jgi:predicted Fe-Mo cluster-binding NifX family protein
MNVCIPVAEDKGRNSGAHGHFGSAPYFVLCDTETGHIRTIENRNEHHAHGACNPTAALGAHRVDAVIVGGIGSRALARLAAMGIKTYQSTGGSVEQDLAALKAGALPELNEREACPGHDHPASAGQVH